jgi:hypothetical protein
MLAVCAPGHSVALKTHNYFVYYKQLTYIPSARAIFFTWPASTSSYFGSEGYGYMSARRSSLVGEGSRNRFPSFGTLSAKPIERSDTNPHLPRNLLPAEALGA